MKRKLKSCLDRLDTSQADRNIVHVPNDKFTKPASPKDVKRFWDEYTKMIDNYLNRDFK